MFKTGLPYRLQNLRTQKDLTQKEVADYLGITQTAYGKIEAGARGLNNEYCVKLADLYQTTCDYILRGIKSENVTIANGTGLSDGAIDVLHRISETIKNIPPDSKTWFSDEDAVANISRGNLIDGVIRNDDLAEAFNMVFTVCLSAGRAEPYKVNHDLIQEYTKNGWFPTWYAIEALKLKVVKAFSSFIDEWCDTAVRLSIDGRNNLDDD